MKLVQGYFKRNPGVTPVMCHPELAEMAHREGWDRMKRHKFWAIATVICMALAMYTGYKHK